MELYTTTAYLLSKSLTLEYSTSFGKSTQLFTQTIRPHIFAIYGLVRIADEIVDTYKQAGALELLDQLEAQTYEAIKREFSTNPIVHAFALTAKQYGISKDLIEPFFASMRLDLSPQTYTQTLYETYIYGSAEVIGLMCLKVFVEGDSKLYASLEAGARSLGAAYQKVNFLRDIASDYEERGRVYFPGVTFELMTENDKALIIKDIEKDFEEAQHSIFNLPPSAKRAVGLSYAYYQALLEELKKASIEQLKTSRVRVSDRKKAAIFLKQSPLFGRGR